MAIILVTGMDSFTTTASEKFLRCISPHGSFSSTVCYPGTYDGMSSAVHVQTFPMEGPVRIVTIINTRSLGQPVFTSPTGHLAHWSPHPQQALGPSISSTRVSQPWQRVFVLENWLEPPTEPFCQTDLQDSRLVQQNENAAHLIVHRVYSWL